MKPITSKEFLTLGKRDYDNGAVRDSIYIALKERKKLIEQQGSEVTEERIEERAKKLMDLFHRWKEEHEELPLHTAKNIISLLIEQMPAKKASVTEGLIRKISEKIVVTVFDREYTKDNSQTQRIIKEMLTEAGVEIVDEK